MKYRTDLTTGTWTPLTGTTQNGTGTERIVTDMSATGAQKFYRVTVVP